MKERLITILVGIVVVFLWMSEYVMITKIIGTVSVTVFAVIVFLFGIYQEKNSDNEN